MYVQVGDVGIPALERWVWLGDAQGVLMAFPTARSRLRKKVSEAFKWLECARRLYDFYQMLRWLDLQMSSWLTSSMRRGGADRARRPVDAPVSEEVEDVYEPIRVVEKRISDELVGSAGTSMRRK